MTQFIDSVSQNSRQDNEFSLEAKNIGRLSRNGVDWLFQNLSFSMTAGEKIGVSGATGSGKTLFLRSLAKLDVLDQGEVLFDREQISGSLIPTYRGKVIYLYQRPCFQGSNVEENLQLPYQFHSHASKRYSPERILSWLADVGRTEAFLHRSISELSGGEKQIVSLLRCLQLDPLVLMLDEPTASLDQETIECLEKLILSWFDSNAARRSYIWISHDRAQLERVSTRRLSVLDGALIEED